MRVWHSMPGKAGTQCEVSSSPASPNSPFLIYLAHRQATMSLSAEFQEV